MRTGIIWLSILATMGCGGTVQREPGGFTWTGFCEFAVACIVGDTCTLPDPAGATAECAAVLSSSDDTLSSEELSVIGSCMNCLNQQPSPCSGEASSACEAVCDIRDETGDKVTAALDKGAHDPKLTCTSGENPFVSGSYEGGGNADGCDASGCNGRGCSPEVAYECTKNTSGGYSCVCTLGKSEGKAFSTTLCGDTGLGIWEQCNM